MPDANGRIKGISLANVKNAYLDSLEEVSADAVVPELDELPQPLCSAMDCAGHCVWPECQTFAP